jgi:hypothetical protein
MLISPLGIIISGPLGELLGIPMLYLLCGLTGVAIIIITWFFTGIRHINYDKLSNSNDKTEREESNKKIAKD